MALFSDIDWVILLAVAAVLLFGKGNGEVLRTLGRWYGRAGRLKQELLSEFTKAAELPTPPPGAPLSIRGALLGIEPTVTHVRGIPAVVRTPPAAPPEPSPIVPSHPWTGSYPTPTWSVTIAAPTVDPEAIR